MAMRYDVEFNSAETGEEESHLYKTYGEVTALLRKAKDGDDIVIHVKEEQGGQL